MFKTSEDYLIQSINERKSKSPENEMMMYRSYLELGGCQKELEKYEDSYNNLIFALNFAKKGIGKISNVLQELANLYEVQKRWDQALSYYEQLSDEYEKEKRYQGFIYERVAKIHQNMGNFEVESKFMLKAHNEYRLEGDERKMSDISGSMRVGISDKS